MVPGESRTALVRRARRINAELGELYPDAHCELDHADPLQLLVATVLSAQSTDRRVNTVTPVLFARYPDAAALAAADRAELEQLITPTGFFRAKTDALLITVAHCRRAHVWRLGQIDARQHLPRECFRHKAPHQGASAPSFLHAPRP